MRAGSESKKGTRALCWEYTEARISQRRKERESEGRGKEREVEETEPLLPVTPGQSRRSRPVIELH